MIESEEQYRRTKEWAARFTANAKELRAKAEAATTAEEQLSLVLQADAAESQARDLSEQASAYEALRDHP